MDERAMGQLNLQATATATPSTAPTTAPFTTPSAPTATPSTAPTATLTLAPRVHASQREKPPQGEILAPHQESSPPCCN